MKFIKSLPLEKRDDIVNAISLKYSPWFFELWAELDGSRIKLEDYQIDYLLDDSDFTIQNKTRQGGGSLGLALKKYFKAYTNPGYRCDIVSVNQVEATDKIKYVRNIHDSLPAKYQVPLTTDNALSIGFHSGRSKSVIRSVAASKGVRGGRKDVVFDEFAHIDKADELYIAAAPAMIRGGQMDIISTPMGNRGLFSDIWHNRPSPSGKKKYDGFSRHEFAWWDVSHFVKNGDKAEAQRVWKEEYESSIAHMAAFVDRFGSERLLYFTDIFPWDMFLQEFCCVFVDETTAFFPFELIARCAKSRRVPGADQEGYEDEITFDPWDVRPEGNLNEVYMGVDFATGKEGGDETAIEVLEKLPNGQLIERYSMTLGGREWSDFDRQLNFIGELIDKFKPSRTSVDQTALGQPLYQSLLKLKPTYNIEPVTFTNVNKGEMAIGLKLLMEKQTIWIQADNLKMQGQIHNITRTVLPGGGIRYHGEPHDDMFWALCLACKHGSYKPFSIFTLG